MHDSLSALHRVVSLLDIYPEIAELSAIERKILLQIISGMAGTASATMADLLARSGVSRASTYRHVAELRRRNLVEERFEHGERTLMPAAHAFELARDIVDTVRLHAESSAEHAGRPGSPGEADTGGGMLPL